MQLNTGDKIINKDTFDNSDKLFAQLSEEERLKNLELYDSSTKDSQIKKPDDVESIIAIDKNIE